MITLGGEVAMSESSIACPPRVHSCYWIRGGSAWTSGGSAGAGGGSNNKQGWLAAAPVAIHPSTGHVFSYSAY